MIVDTNIMSMVRRDDPPAGPPGPPMLTPEQFAALPHDSIGPKLNAVIWSLPAISGGFLALRLYCKAVRSKGLWWDDWILAASWVSAPLLLSSEGCGGNTNLGARLRANY